MPQPLCHPTSPGATILTPASSFASIYPGNVSGAFSGLQTILVNPPAIVMGWTIGTACLVIDGIIQQIAEGTPPFRFTWNPTGGSHTIAVYVGPPEADQEGLWIGAALPLNDLRKQALADGATFGYAFGEASGSLLDFAGGGSPLSVATQVTRGVTGPSGPDGKAYQFSGAAGSGAPAYGHCDGTRPTTAGLTSITYEAVVKATASGVNLEWLGGLWVRVVNMFLLGTDAAGDASGLIASGGGQTQKFVQSGGGVPSGFNHYVWQCGGGAHANIPERHVSQRRGVNLRSG